MDERPTQDRKQAGRALARELLVPIGVGGSAWVLCYVALHWLMPWLAPFAGFLALTVTLIFFDRLNEDAE